jgi:hypothetical protein
MAHDDEIKAAALKILDIARRNIQEALDGMEDLKGLVIDQQTRIDTINSVIDELSKFEDK